MDSAERQSLRATFEEVPELYELARPTYPPALFDDLVELAGLPEAARLLEIGPGTGKATVSLAERGFEVVGVELGPKLAAIAREKLAGFPAVEIVNAEFEAWTPARAGFDAVVAFTAFHWVDPAVGYEKAAGLLREGGALAVVQTNHVLSEGGDSFWLEVEDDYREVIPDEEGTPPPSPDEVVGPAEELEASGCFASPEERRYLWDVTYSAERYVGVLETYSGHRALDPEVRRRLYERIRRRIEARPGRSVRKSYLGVLVVARRL